MLSAPGRIRLTARTQVEFATGSGPLKSEARWLGHTTADQAGFLFSQGTAQMNHRTTASSLESAAALSDPIVVLAFSGADGMIGGCVKIAGESKARLASPETPLPPLLFRNWLLDHKGTNPVVIRPGKPNQRWQELSNVVESVLGPPCYIALYDLCCELPLGPVCDSSDFENAASKFLGKSEAWESLQAAMAYACWGAIERHRSAMVG